MKLRRTIPSILLAACLGGLLPLPAEAAEAPSEPAVRLGEEHIVFLRAGVIVKAVGGDCVRLVARAPVPFDWPEQTVAISEQEVSPLVKKLSYRMVDSAARQMIVEIPHLPEGAEARAIVTFEVKRRVQIAPAETGDYLAPSPRQLGRDARPWLKPSPGTPSDDPEIQRLSQQIVGDDAVKWEQVQAIHQWVIDNVEYQFDETLRGAADALKSGHGDCEEMTSLFIALCRASKVPARTVWVPGHCYPEFYLADKSGRGQWFPCEATGPGAFGGTPELRPILQKGDNFPDPQIRGGRTRYLHGTLQGLPAKNSAGRPTLQIVLEIVNGPTGAAATSPPRVK